MTPQEIKRLWYRHAVAENARQLEELVATLTEDCLYEVVPWRQVFRGKEEVRRFYRELWTALPDVTLTLLRHVIDERCLVEESVVHGTHRGPWLGLPPTGKRIDFPLVIFFPVRDSLFTADVRFPQLAEVKRNFERAHLMLESLAQQRDLGQQVGSRADSTLGEMLIFACYHRRYHVGKMAILRALLGKPRRFGRKVPAGPS